MGATASTLSAMERMKVLAPGADPKKAAAPKKAGPKKRTGRLASRMAFWAQKQTKPSGRQVTDAKARELCGLVVRGDRATALRLDRVHVRAQVRDLCVRYEVTQRFTNNMANPVEALYTLALPKDVAVYGFEAEVQGKRIVAQIETKEDAEDAYDDAIAMVSKQEEE